MYFSIQNNEQVHNHAGAMISIMCMFSIYRTAGFGLPGCNAISGVRITELYKYLNKSTTKILNYSFPAT